MITMIVAQAIPSHVRGYLGRFLVEVAPGIFTGRLSPVVADRLWARISTDLECGSMTIVTTSRSTEQGYRFRSCGPSDYQIVDLDGLSLIGQPVKVKDEPFETESLPPPN